MTNQDAGQGREQGHTPGERVASIDASLERLTVEVERASRRLEAAEGLAEAAGAIIACLGDGGYLPTAGKPKTDALRAALAKWEGRE